MAIYIAAHKKINVFLQKGYVPLHVGKAIASVDLPYIGDNIGDNISEKNPNFCELTALYWIWKNQKDETVGLVHYRRFFFKNYISFLKKSYFPFSKANEILREYDIILPHKTVMLKRNVYSNYKESHRIEDLEVCGRIILKLYPEYYNAFKEILKTHKYYAFNMFITRRNIFEEYMQWLFSIINEIEMQISVENLDKYNQRVFGFLAERLFNVWIKKNNNLKIKELPVFNTEQNQMIQFIQGIEDLMKRIVLK